MNLAERARATEKVLERYRELPLDWQRAHCIALARAQGRALGHRLPPLPRIRSAIGARRALAKRGAANVVELMDQFFPRWPAPAFMLVGDLCAIASGDGLHSVSIGDGLGNLFGWHEATGNRRLETVKFAAADIVAAWKL